MSERLTAITQQIIEGTALSFDEMSIAFGEIMDGNASPAQMAAFSVGLKMRGETPDDIAAGAAVLRQRALTITPPQDAVDIVGTGGDGIGTFNISTATAFVIAGAGIPVAKHGNKAVSSKSGAADVLSALGITIDCPFEQLETALKDAHICFLMAPRHHAAMRHVGPVRAELKIRTIFNLLGPLSNPALVNRIMVGVYDAHWLRPFAEALKQLGTSHAWIVHGANGLDEMSTTGENQICALADGIISDFTLHPEELGIAVTSIDALKGGDADVNAAALRKVLDGETGPYRDIVLLNATAGLVATGHESDMKIALGRAQDSLDSGAARTALTKLIEITGTGS
jgi:anthranilate phosphoribosyltransferase